MSTSMSAPDVLRQNRIGNTDVWVSQLGYGASALGNLYTAMEDDEPAGIIDEGWRQGVRYFDVAPHYGLGLAEKRLGAQLCKRSGFTLSTKVGRVLLPNDAPSGKDSDIFDVPDTHVREWNFTAAGIRRSLEDSLERLGLDRIDIALVHDPDDHFELARDHAFPELARLRDEGLIGAVGVGMNQWQMPAEFVRDCDIDVVLVAGRYTLLDQSAAEVLLPACEANDVSVIAAAVYNSGILATHASNPDARFNYEPAAPALHARLDRIRGVCEDFGVTIPQAALQFPLQHPVVRSVLVGARSVDEIRSNCELMKKPVYQDFWNCLLDSNLIGPAWVPA